ncbi:unknown [Acidaminococcus sp. CAG:542]|nr:unknown [Acidaminococcus sp. CAG:542]
MIQFRIDFRQIFRFQQVIELARFRPGKDGQPGKGLLDGLPGPGDLRPGILFLGPHGFQRIAADQPRIVIGLEQICFFPFQGCMPFQQVQILLEGPERYIVEGCFRTEGHPGAVQGCMLGCQVVGGALLLGLQPAEEVRFPGSIDAQPGYGRIPVGRVDHPRIGTHIADFVVDPLRGFIPSVGASHIQPGQGFSLADPQLGPCFFHPGLGRLEIPVVFQ